MRISFSNSDIFGAFLIRWGSSDKFFGLADCAHVMIIFDNRLVFHSLTNGGTRVDFLPNILRIQKIVHQLKPKTDLTQEQEEQLYQFLLGRYKGRLYDYLGVLYFAWRVLLKKFFGKPLPLTNKWNSELEYFCTEIAQGVDDFYIQQFGHHLVSQNENFSLLTPQALYEKILASGRFEEVA